MGGLAITATDQQLIRDLYPVNGPALTAEALVRRGRSGRTPEAVRQIAYQIRVHYLGEVIRCAGCGAEVLRKTRQKKYCSAACRAHSVPGPRQKRVDPDLIARVEAAKRGQLPELMPLAEDPHARETQLSWLRMEEMNGPSGPGGTAQK